VLRGVKKRRSGISDRRDERDERDERCERDERDNGITG
jgi:hypothetical protein